MNSLFLPALAALAATASAVPVFTETFDTLPAAAAWKLDSASIAGGKLRLDGIGDETVFVDASIETLPARAELNFARARVVLTLEDIELGGLAPAEKQAFVLHLGSDRAIGGSRADYVRLCINGTGNLVLSVGTPSADGRTVDLPLVNRPIALPIKKLVLALDRQGYRLELADGFAPGVSAAPWGTDIGWARWESATPYLFIKAVRRPSPGTCEVSLGALTIETDQAPSAK